MADRTTIRILFFSSWAEQAIDAAEYLRALPGRDLAGSVPDPSNPDLLQMARLDCDWNGECLRCFAAMEHRLLEFLPARILGVRGLLQSVMEGEFGPEQPWLVLVAQSAEPYAPVIGKLLADFTAKGGRVMHWAYDDASRTMPCFKDSIAPYLSVLIHDEDPLEPGALKVMPPDCRTLRQSWTANVLPFGARFEDDPDPSIMFLGSKMGVTGHRQTQIDALSKRFGARFQAITDHSVSVEERRTFTAVKVHVCPEGRKFHTPSMSRSHTDRPFWAGCMGQVPVSENSAGGERLVELMEQKLIIPYAHGDIGDLVRSCEQALEIDNKERRRLYDWYNREGTVGPTAARMIAEYYEVRPSDSTYHR